MTSVLHPPNEGGVHKLAEYPIKSAQKAKLPAVCNDITFLGWKSSLNCDSGPHDIRANIPGCNSFAGTPVSQDATCLLESRRLRGVMDMVILLELKLTLADTKAGAVWIEASSFLSTVCEQPGTGSASAGSKLAPECAQSRSVTTDFQLWFTSLIQVLRVFSLAVDLS
jgi:hypothetical protein